MATIKARYPTWFPQQPAIGGLAYDNGVRVGKMMSVSISPEFEQVSALGGGGSVFKRAGVALNTSCLPLAAYKAMFGGSGAAGELIDPTYSAARGGFGYITGELEDGCSFWRVHFLRDVVFVPPNESAVTLNGQVTFTTPSISGAAWPDYSEGRWRERKDVTALDEAVFLLESIGLGGRLIE